MKWIERPELLDYVIESYACTEETGANHRVRRLFLWQDEAETRMGNVEAFFDHMRTKFNLSISRDTGTSDIHELLRDLGERLCQDGEKLRGPVTGEHKRPDPESWRVEQPQ